MAKCLALVVLSLALVVWWWVSRTPTITRNYVEEFNREVRATDPQTLAWPELKRLLIALPDLPDSLWRPEYIENKGWTELMPGDPDWPDVVEYIAKVQPDIRALQRAAHREHLGYILTDADDEELSMDGWRRAKKEPDAVLSKGTPNPSLMDVNFLYLGKFRACARLFRSDARVAVESGEAERVVTDVEALLDLSRLSRERGGLLGHLVSHAIDALTMEVVTRGIERSPTFFSAEQLHRLDSMIASRAGKQDFDDALAFERVRFQDSLQRSFTDNGRGNGTITLSGVHWWLDNGGLDSGNAGSSNLDRLHYIVLAAFLLGDRKTQLGHFDAIVQSQQADGRVEPWIFDGPSATTKLLWEPDGFIASTRVAPALVCAPSLHKVAVARAQLDEQIAATRTVIAMHQFRLARGRWPVSLEELRPEFLGTIPTDRFTGQPLQYRLAEDRPLLYSVGANRIDDGGKPAPFGKWAGEWVRPSALPTDPRFRAGRPQSDNIYFPPSRANEPAPAPAD